MKTDCARFEEVADAGGPRNQPEADFVSAHVASCDDCRALEQMLAALALRPNDDAHFQLDALTQRRTIEAVLREAPVAAPRRIGRVVLALAAVLAVLIGVRFLIRPAPVKPPELVAQQATPPQQALPPPAPPRLETAALRAIAGRDERALGSKFEQGASVRSGAAMLGISVSAQAWLRATPGTEFTFVSLRDHDLRIDLRAGHLDVHVPHGQGIDLSIHTPHGDVKVIGTAFSLEVAKAGSRLAVAQGTVQVEANGVQTRVTAGQALSLGATTTSPASKAELASVRESLALERVVGDGAGRLIVTAGRQVTIDNVELGAAPVRTMAASGAHSISRIDARNRSHRTIANVTGDREVVVSDRSVASSSMPKVSEPERPLPPSPITAPVAQAESTEQLMQQAQRARTLKDWPEAARAYSAIIERHEMSAAAEVARLSLGQLKVDQLGAPAQGQTLCATYIERNPSGALLAEAELCQIRAFASLGQTANELRAIDSFLSRWPNDFNAARLVRRKAALQP